MSERSPRVHERRTRASRRSGRRRRFVEAEQGCGRVRVTRTRIVAALLVGVGRDCGLASASPGRARSPGTFAREAASTLVRDLAPSGVDTVEGVKTDEDAE